MVPGVHIRVSIGGKAPALTVMFLWPHLTEIFQVKISLGAFVKKSLNNTVA